MNGCMCCHGRFQTVVENTAAFAKVRSEAEVDEDEQVKAKPGLD